MVELLIFCIFGVSLIVAHFSAAVAYKIRTKTKRSIWYIMDNII
jgi:hypothetical protein